MDINFHLLPLAPAAIIERLGRFSEQALPDVIITSFEAYTPLGTFGFVEKNKVSGKHLLENPTFQDQLGILSQHPYLDFNHVNLLLAHPQGQLTIQYLPQQDRTLKVTIPDALSVPERLKLTEVLHKQFQLLRKDQILSSHLDPGETPIARFAEGLAQDLASQGAKLAQLSSDQLKEFNRVLIEKTAALEKLYQEKEANLQKSYGEKENALNDRIKAQQGKEAAFDLRENTVVRRAIFDQLLKIIDEQKTVVMTPTTMKKRIVVHVVCVTLMVIGAISVGLAAIHLYRSTAFEWRLLIPSTGGLALMASTAVFYLKWQDRWFQDHANAEFSNRKFKADMTRASWMVEMFFEWAQKEEKRPALPKELVASCTANLFQSETRDGTRHPFDDLSSLLKEASKVKLGKGGFEFEKETKKA